MSKILNKIIQSAHEYDAIIDDLKADSPIFPEILLKEHRRNEFYKHRLGPAQEGYASTLVRIFRDGKWYKIHCVETMILRGTTTDEPLLIANLVRKAYQVLMFYKITGIVKSNGLPLEEVDHDQRSEEERLNIGKPQVS